MRKNGFLKSSLQYRRIRPAVGVTKPQVVAHGQAPLITVSNNLGRSDVQSRLVGQRCDSGDVFVDQEVVVNDERELGGLILLIRR
jgi:hypothetical protein